MFATRGLIYYFYLYTFMCNFRNLRFVHLYLSSAFINFHGIIINIVYSYVKVDYHKSLCRIL